MSAWRSNLPALTRAMNSGEQRGLHAAAYVLRGAVQVALKPGYTSGDFITGTSVNAVTIGQVYQEGTGWAIRVGTNLLYNLFWELGHRNVYLRKFVRVERWRPALVDNRFEIRAAFNREYVRELKAAGF